MIQKLKYSTLRALSTLYSVILRIYNSLPKSHFWEFLGPLGPGRQGIPKDLRSEKINLYLGPEKATFNK